MSCSFQVLAGIPILGVMYGLSLRGLNPKKSRQPISGQGQGLKPNFGLWFQVFPKILVYLGLFAPILEELTSVMLKVALDSLSAL
ncbi:hypothetical protein DSO57_1038003 [Entomophthora muscae]|uniref:Uncharacterized protein n=1 Tax=Entomophthora muscae TaxID=34485 RepID=A0ACC2RPP2_9FUNG|nr:hypothetical protein DSO57_1038003 [Entomophthora muscae]